MKALDRLRQHGSIPDAYSWASIASGAGDAPELVAHVDRLEARVAELEALARRCADCGRGARVLIATQDIDGGVVYLGPGCSRKRLQAIQQRAEALPIGGAR